MESKNSSGGLHLIPMQSSIHNQTLQTSDIRFENIGFAACLSCITIIGVTSNLFLVDFIPFLYSSWTLWVLSTIISFIDLPSRQKVSSHWPIAPNLAGCWVSVQNYDLPDQPGQNWFVFFWRLLGGSGWVFQLVVHHWRPHCPLLAAGISDPLRIMPASTLYLYLGFVQVSINSKIWKLITPKYLDWL